jgi:pSer/pThr/pTyr-binding forkhead associated (FHA) protein
MTDWNLILFGVRWALIALVYAVLMVILVAVYRETSTRIQKKQVQAARIHGSLRIIQSGSDPHLAPGTVIELKPLTNLGAAPDNDVILGDKFVSGHHFQMRWDGRFWWVEDLSSKNGTWVNQQMVMPGRPQAVAGGVTIAAGDVLMILLDQKE